MGKDITCNILKTYCKTDETTHGDTRLCEISWNNKKCLGVDIRKYDRESDKMYKGLSITYNGFTDIILSAIENGLCDIDKVKEAVSKREKSLFNDDDFKKLFKKMNHEQQEYKRDVYGYLRDSDGRIVISSRRKGLR